MTRTIAIGVDSNPKYLYFLPLIKWAWAKFNWDMFVFYIGDTNYLTDFVESNIGLFNIRITKCNGYKSETVAQVSRMYTYDYTGQFIMTSDADILPLSDYWKPNDNEITCYGRDLSNEHQPMCFVAMPSNHWKVVMNGDENPGLKGMFWDLNFWYPKAKNKWCVDQDILTEHLFWFKDKIIINRGIDPKTNYPIGRVDRSAWSLNHKTLTDAHLPHDILTNDESFRKVMQLLHTVWPKEDFKWFVDYTKEFKKLL